MELNTHPANSKKITQMHAIQDIAIAIFVWASKRMLDENR